MLLGIIFIIFLTVFVVVTLTKSKYMISFATALISMLLLLISLMMYISKMTSFRYFFQIEFALYRFIGDIKISFYDIKWILNIAIIMFPFAMTMIIINDIYTDKRKLKYIFIYIITSCLYLFANSPLSSEYVYLFISKGNSVGEQLRLFIKEYNFIYLISFSSLPYFTIIRNLRNTILLFKKRHLKAILVSVILLQFLYFMIISFTPLKFFINNIDVYNYTSISLIYNEHLYIYIPFIIVVVLLVCIFILLRFRVLDEWSFLKHRKRNQNIKVLFKDMRHLFHSYKNAMLSIDFLTKKATKNYGEEKGMEALCAIQGNVDVFLKQATRFFEIYNNKLVLNLDSVCIAECIESACKRLDFTNINVNKNYHDDFISVCGDFDYLEEMFVNILGNSIEAMSIDEKNDKNIEIGVWLEKPWVCVRIVDNGPGINKKLMNDIFKPFCSTKKSFKNWGFGLAFVKNIVEAHLGYIDVDSKINEYTEFQILLPID